jgi:hypothetical protein
MVFISFALKSRMAKRDEYQEAYKTSGLSFNTADRALNDQPARHNIEATDERRMKLYINLNRTSGNFTY